MKNLFLALLGILTTTTPAFAATNDQQDAVARLEQNVKANPNHPELWLHLGFAYRKAEQLDKAQSSFEKALSLDANSKEALSMLGLIYEKKRQNPDALKMWQRYLALETDPNKRAMAEK